MTTANAPEQTDEQPRRDERGRFSSGGTPGPGRKKGGKDLATQILDTPSELNDRSQRTNYLLDLAEEYPKVFVGLLARCVPRDMNITSQVQVSYEDWLADVEARAAEERAALELDKTSSAKVKKSQTKHRASSPLAIRWGGSGLSEGQTDRPCRNAGGSEHVKEKHYLPRKREMRYTKTRITSLF